MKSWTDWEIIRRRVTVSGIVSDSNGKPLKKVPVGITAGPEGFQKGTDVETCGGKDSAPGEERCRNLARTQADGLYWFMDLPMGKYTLTAWGGRSAKAFVKRVSVNQEKVRGVKLAQADITLA